MRSVVMATLMVAGLCQGAPIDEVNTKIGTISHMLVPVFPTIQRPNSMLRMVPINESARSDVVDGFTLNVCAHRQGNAFRMLPLSGEPSTWRFSTRYDQSVVLPYYYSVFLEGSEAFVEFAPAEKAAIFSVTFEGNTARAIHLAPRSGAGQLVFDGASVSGFDVIRDAKVYTWIEFDAPAKKLDQTKLVLGFDPQVKTVKMRYGISFISVEQARKNLAQEIADFNLERLSKETKKLWSKTLERIEVDGGSTDERAVFYSALYRCHERMVKISEEGRYAWFNQVNDDKGVPFWADDWIWDTFRAQHPLMAILHPTAQGEKLASYIRMYEQSGWVPTFPNFFGDAHCMNGHHAVSLFIDAWRKGIRNFDLEKAFAGMKQTMKTESMIPWCRGPATELDAFYWEKGYFPALRPGEEETVPQVVKGERRQSVAVTLAAAYDAWCLAQIAQELGRTEDAAYFAKHALDYRNLWKGDTQFFHPKDKDGKWIEPFDYKYAGGQGARDYYDENNGWTYLWEVYHNVPDLIQLFGSAEAFNAKLDRLFVEGPNRAIWEFYNVLPDSTGLTGMFVMGNEPSLHIPYLYNYSGQPWKTQKRVRMLLDAWWRNDRMGICGDEDGGGLSAFAIFSMMGFYPVTPGSPNYTLCSPVFKKIQIHLENGKTFTIKAPRASEANKYIQSVKINGQPWQSTDFPHDVIVQGGTVEIELGPRPNKAWATGAQQSNK